MNERPLPTVPRAVPPEEVGLAVRLADLCVVLGSTEVVCGVTFGAERGSLTAILGPNGAGKTTSLRAIGGLIPYSGSVVIGGNEVRSWAPRARARRVAFVRQQVEIAFDLTVRDLVSLGRFPHGGWLSPYSEADTEIIERAIEMVDLGGLAERPVSAMSGGEQRRALLAQAFAQNADVLLLDEPTAHLDLHHQVELLELLRSRADAGATIIGAFHDIELACRYADAVVVMDQGQLVASGAPEEVITEALLAEIFHVQTRISSDDLGVTIRLVAGAR